MRGRPGACGHGPRAARSMTLCAHSSLAGRPSHSRVLKKLKRSGGEPCRPDVHQSGSAGIGHNHEDPRIEVNARAAGSLHIPLNGGLAIQLKGFRRETTAQTAETLVASIVWQNLLTRGTKTVGRTSHECHSHAAQRRRNTGTAEDEDGPPSERATLRSSGATVDETLGFGVAALRVSSRTVFVAGTEEVDAANCVETDEPYSAIRPQD